MKFLSARKIKLSRFVVFGLFAAFVSPTARGWDFSLDPSQSRTRSGIEVERFAGGDEASHTQGWMAGIHGSYYPRWTSNLSYGYSFYFGLPRDGGSLSNDNLVYGGLTLGYDATVSHIFTYQFQLLTGYGYGNVAPNLSGQSFALQPTAGAGVTLVKGWRLTFNTGYLFMPNANGFSSMTWGIRLEHKTESTDSHGVDF